jgi:hypothetical protein
MPPKILGGTHGNWLRTTATRAAKGQEPRFGDMSSYR